MKLKDNILFIFLGVICTTLLFGCSTKKNTSGTRAYHAFTTQYNLFFNAQQAYDETLNARYDSYRDDFSRMLPMYLTDTTQNKKPGGAFDRTIEKTMTAIREHSIASKPRRDPGQEMTQEYRDWLRQEEFNPFLKNAWLLMGKAQVQNSDYTDALSTFSQILRMYPNEKELISETQIWMMRAYAAMGWFYDAENLINMLQMNPLPKNLKNLFNETYAYFHLQRKDYASAIPYLQQAIRSEDNPRQKRRLQYLTGQLYQLMEQPANAFSAFQEMKGLSTPPDIVMQAVIGQSKVSGGNQQQKMIGELEKMTGISRYKDRRADLFVALGDIFTAKNDTARANKYYAEAKKEGANLPTSVIAVADSVKAPADSSMLLAEQHSSEREMFRAVARARNLHSQPFSPQDETETTSATIDSVQFNINRDAPHVFLMMFSENQVNKNNLLFAIANYNFSTFMLREFGLSFVEIKPMEALQIRGFNSYEEVSSYGKMLLSDSVFIAEAPTQIIPLIISEENLQILLKGKTLADYQVFYKTHFGDGSAPVVLKEPKKYSPEIPVAISQEKDTNAIGKETVPAAQPEEKRIASTEKRSVEETQAQRQSELERKAEEALKQQTEKTDPKSRRKILKERERERRKLLRQREQERAALLKQREKALKRRQKQRERELRARNR